MKKLALFAVGITSATLAFGQSSVGATTLGGTVSVSGMALRAVREGDEHQGQQMAASGRRRGGDAAPESRRRIRPGVDLGRRRRAQPHERQGQRADGAVQRHAWRTTPPRNTVTRTISGSGYVGPLGFITNAKVASEQADGAEVLGRSAQAWSSRARSASPTDDVGHGLQRHHHRSLRL